MVFRAFGGVVMGLLILRVSPELFYYPALCLRSGRAPRAASWSQTEEPICIFQHPSFES